ncbi:MULTISPECIES: hypothetical protein [unclassified Prochlorococcus]|uniref:hypothetical protein n=1 Tax=unclassified Prochlorococcus TaxID=2627481 RepID=UPI000533AD7A|nr:MULTISPECIES: hypothetical protein [unclassified Prochlorococcus]KGG14919.1 hypothetical protein EV06_1985 [Prochlorococcus sp. MIT 0602]KGG15648.1 hypothetical protein EV07_1613 [Prochlorococcus sp. MIT 0603]
MIAQISRKTKPSENRATRGERKAVFDVKNNSSKATFCLEDSWLVKLATSVFSCPDSFFKKLKNK